MGKAPILFILFVAAYLLVEMYTLEKAKHRLEPLYILDQFLLANHAVDKCGNPSEQQMQRFRRNLEAVIRRTQKKLAESNPDKSAAQIKQIIDARKKAREQEVEAIIEQGDCTDPRMRTLLKRFEIRARLRVG